MLDERFARADLLTERAFAAACEEPVDVDATVNRLSQLARGDGPAFAIARARLAAHLAHRSTAAMARTAMAFLDGAEVTSGSAALI